MLRQTRTGRKYVLIGIIVEVHRFSVVRIDDRVQPGFVVPLAS